MKKDQLEKILRPLIKEEVLKVINSVLPSLLAEAVVLQQEQTIAPTPTMAQMVNQPPQHRPMVNESVKFSDNPVLNEILQQTTPGFAGADNMTPAQMMAEQNDLSNMNAMMQDMGPMDDYNPNMPAMPPQMQQHPQVQMQPQNAMAAQSMLPDVDTSGGQSTVSAADLDPATMNALTRDYSGMMKAVDQKQKQKGPSNIDFSKI